MNSKTLQATGMIAANVAACLLYFWVARILKLEYQTKSAIKLLLFLGIPLFSWLIVQRKPLREVMTFLLPQKQQYKRLLAAFTAGVLVIILANLLIDPLCQLFGVSSIIEEIQNRTHTNRQQLILALIYIPVVNALAEELFFRSFCYLELANFLNRSLAFIFSAALFALYHLSIFQNWFSPPILLLTLGSLFLCGLALNHIARRDNHLAGVWMLHGLVNVAIISISLKFF